MIKKGYKNINNPEVALQGTNLYLLNYSIETVPVKILPAKNKNDNTIKANLLMSEKRAILHSNKMEIYQDELNTVTILTENKIVYVSKASKGNKDLRANKLKMLNDSLWNTTSVTSCKTIKDTKADKEIKLSVNSLGQKFFHIENVTVLLNSKTETIYKVFIKYTPGSENFSLNITFNTIDYKYKSNNLDNQVATDLLKAIINNSKYSGYKLVDLRNKK